MKVVFINRYFYPDQSATSQLLTDLTCALCHAGLDVHVICSRQRYDDPHASLATQQDVDGAIVHRVWTTRFGRDRLLGRALDYATFYVSGALAMLKLLRRGDTLIAKTDPPLISIFAAAACKLTGAHQINWLQDIFPEVASELGANPLPPPLNSLLRRWRNLSLRSARLNVVLGERMRERLVGMGIPQDKIHIIENWAESGAAAPKAAVHSALRARMSLENKCVVGYSGNLGRAHEFRTLLTAAESLQEDTEIVFLMIGGGAGMSQLARAVEERGLKNFRFLPYQPRESLADALAAADVHWVSLLPALEGLIVPSKFYGILAAARPVIFIGDQDGELAREIRGCGCGATVAIGDTPELERLLCAWKADQALRDSMGHRGYRLYCARFGARRAFDQWKEILTPSNRAADA
jgi:glycosyltransferase involved in cell wall biosynthesis